MPDILSGPVWFAVAVVATLACLVLAALWWRARAAARARATDRATSADVQARLAAVLSAGREGMVVHSPAGTVLEVNAAAAGAMGMGPAELVGRRLTDLPVRWVTDDGVEVAVAAVFARRPQPAPGDLSAFAVGLVPRGGGAPHWVQPATREVTGCHGGTELVTTFTDMTGPREVRAALARSELQFRAAMENAPIGMALVDPQWRLEEVNRAFAVLLGTRPEALVGRDLSSFSHPEDRHAERAAVERLVTGQEDRFNLDKRYVRADGQTVWVSLDVVLVRRPDGQPDHFVAQVTDVTELRLQAEKLAHRAAHDPLTGLANRSLMQEVLQQVVQAPGAEDRVAVIMVDLDEFKQINDRYGHAAGDAVLVHVAGVLRAATAGRGTVARLGGDEFVVVVHDGDAARAGFEIATGIHRGLRTPVRAERRRLEVRASVGVAVADHDLVQQGPMALLAAADAAVYRAKAGGRSRTEVYDATMAVPEGPGTGSASELGNAIEHGQLVVHYQPVVELASGQVVGHEALVRWQHPVHGLLMPAEFLDTAGQAGLGAALGVAVLTQVMGHLVAGTTPGWVSVNVSAEQLGDGELVERIVAEVGRHHIGPGRLVVELTEASLEADGPLRHALNRLRQAGVPVLLDDFGTGVWPLSYLRDMPVDGVKLDMSFAAGIPADPAAAQVSRALAALAQQMELATVAEGIETEAQAVVLQEAGWVHGQGWWFGEGRSEPVTGL